LVHLPAPESFGEILKGRGRGGFPLESLPFKVLPAPLANSLDERAQGFSTAGDGGLDPRRDFRKHGARDKPLAFQISERCDLSRTTHFGKVTELPPGAFLLSAELARKVPEGGTRMIIEMRTYKTKPGKRPEFLEIFRSKTIPAHAEIGMKVLGPFLSAEDPDTFFWMRGFPDLPSREPMKARFYEGELWKGELENTLLPMLESYAVVLVEDPENRICW
jgi:NIPSNAP